MEKIDLNNYEAYFLDYMEGTLSAEEKHDLFAFLELHPELKAEMEEDFNGIELIPESITLDTKASLKVASDKLFLTPQTVEEYMIAAVENQLTVAQHQELKDYIKANGLEKTMAYYQSTILKPNTNEVFAEKAQLKQKEGMVISMTFITRIAAVAAVGAILVTIALNWNGSGAIDQEPSNGVYFAGNVKEQNGSYSDKRSGVIVDDMNETNMMAMQEEFDQQKSTPDLNPLEIAPDRIEPENEIVKNERIGTDTTENRTPVVIPRKDPLDGGSDIVEELKEDEPNEDASFEKDVENDQDDIVVVTPKSSVEEPYKIVTNAASNIVNRDVEFTRERNLASNDYVAYSFKIGKFEFERKKTSR